MNFRHFFARKPISELIVEASESKGFEKTLGPFQLIMLGIGAIIGAGIFVLAGPAAGLHAGPAITVSLALCGLACACAGLCYAELSSTIPISGGAYTYAYASLGEVVAWLVTGLIVLTYILGASTVATGWSGYFVSFLADYGVTIPPEFASYLGKEIVHADGSITYGIINLPAFFIVILLGAVVFFGADTSATVNNIIVAIKMFVIFAFILIGASYINFENWKPFIPQNTGVPGEFGLSGIVSGAGVIFLAFSGFDAVAATAQETKNPQRDLPIGILGSLFICTIIYILVSAVLTGVVPYTELAVAEPMAVAVNAMNMPWFSYVIKIGAISGLTSVILVLMYAVVRVLFTVTHDGLLPKWLAKSHEKYHTPHIMTFFVVMSMALLSALFPVDKLSKLANFGTLSNFSIVCLITLYLRYKEPKLIRGFKCPFMPWVPIAGIIVFTVIIISLPMEILLYAALWLGFLLIVYFVYGQHNSKLQKELVESCELESEQQEKV